jgi:RNA polymerase sigma-70 factor, ECF subfamily
MELKEAVCRCKEGDKEAWEMVINAYGKKIYNMALNFIGDRDEASDITQEIFVKVYQNIEKFQDDRNFTSWLLTLTRNHCIDYWRKNKKYYRTEEIDHTVSDNGPTPEDQVVRHAEIQLLRKKLLELEPDMRIFLTMRDIESMSYQEISDQLDIPLGTVKSRINRARLKLTRLMDGKGANA